MGLRNGQWPKQDANLGHEIWAPAVGFHEIWIVGWLASARENGMRAAVRLGFGERVPCKPQGGPLFSSFAASFITAGLFLWDGEEEKLRKIDQRAGMACQGQWPKVLPRAKRQAGQPEGLRAASAE